MGQARGKIYEMKMMVCKNEAITPNEMLDQLEFLDMDSTISVAATIKYNVSSSLRVLRELGVFKT